MSRMQEKIDHLDWCLDRIEDAGPDEPAGRLIAADVPTLLAAPEIAHDLVERIAIMDEPVEKDAPEARLLETLLDEARRNEQCGKRDGRAFRNAVDRACRYVTSRHATQPGLIALTRAYRRADLQAPSELTQAREATMSAEAAALDLDPQGVSQKLADQLLAAIDGAGGRLARVHTQLSEAMASLPDTTCQALIRQLANWDDPRLALLATYLTLDGRERLGQAAAEALHERAAAQSLDDAVAGRLAWVRNGLPAGPIANAVDAALAAYQDQYGAWPSLPTLGHAACAYMSLPDSAGKQYLMLGEQRDAGACWCLIVMAPIDGVRDAYVSLGLSQAEEAALMDTVWPPVDCYTMSLATAQLFIAAAAADNQDRGERPPSGLLDVAVATNQPPLCPRALSPSDWLAILDPEGKLAAMTSQKRGRLINQSADWPKHIKAPAAWFEDNETIRDILAVGGGEQTVRSRLRAYLHSRRDWWAALFFRAALVASESDPEQLGASMTVTAQALLDGREIRRIPIMEAIIDTTVQGLSSRTADTLNERLAASDDGSPDDPGHLMLYPDDHRATLQPLFDTRGGVGAWPAGYHGVHGYLFAMATHPHVINPGEWLEFLFGDPQQGGLSFKDEDELERVINALGAIYNTINAYVTAQQGALPRGAEPSPTPAHNLRADAPIRQWAQGFCIAVDNFDHLLDRLATDPGKDSEAYESVEMAETQLRMVASPESFRAELGAQRQHDVTAEEVSDHAVQNLIPSVPFIAMIANHYRDPDGAPSHASPQTPTKTQTEPRQPARSNKIGRNEPCPCGSGNKHKRCCGNSANT